MTAPENIANELHAGYRASGFNQRLGFGKKAALLIVDMCQAYFDPNSPLALPDDSAIDACRSLVRQARAANTPIVWTRVEYEPGGTDGGIFYRKVAALRAFDRGSPLGAWLPGLAPTTNETVITKQQASAFFATDLDASLRQIEVDTVIICGVSTSGCVRATAVDACQYGFVPIVVDEACGDRSPELHANTLFDLDAKYADVESLTHVLAAIASMTVQ